MGRFERCPDRFCHPPHGPLFEQGQGLEALFGRMGWALSDALAVGDAPNDLSMFASVGWSVAVGGAFEEVQAAADVVSPHHHGETFPPLVEAILQAIAAKR